MSGWLALAAGHPSLSFVVLFTVVSAWLAALMFAYMVGFAVLQHALASYRASRRKVFEPAIAMVLGEESLETVVEALRPRRSGDEEAAQAVMLDSMRHLAGPPFELLQAAAERLGFVERNLRKLSSRRRSVRGRAIAALGVMRVRRAVPVLVERLNREPRRLQLAILRALAAIGDPAALPVFAAAADSLPPPMLPRLASLMLEFGPPALPALLPLINRHAGAFPPRALAEVLRLASEQHRI